MTALSSPTLFALPELPPIAPVAIEHRWKKLVSFTVPGIPKPGGSKTAQLIRRKGGAIVMKNGRPLITVRDAAKGNADWKQDVKVFARQAYNADPVDAVLAIDITFTMPRIKSHFRANGQLKPNAPIYHQVKPDCTKLMRSTEDALTGLLWRDDATIGEQRLRKVYGERPGAEITVYVLEGRE